MTKPKTLIPVLVVAVQERREYAKLSPSLRALVLQRLCEANMEARDHVRTWMTDDTEVDDLRCEVTPPAANPQPCFICLPLLE